MSIKEDAMSIIKRAKELEREGYEDYSAYTMAADEILNVRGEED